MPSKKTENKEIIVAVIGVVGAVLTAMIVNWGQYIFNRGSVPDEKVDKSSTSASRDNKNPGGNGSGVEVSSGENNEAADGKSENVSEKIRHGSASNGVENKIIIVNRPAPPSSPPPSPPSPPPALQCGRSIDTSVAVVDLKALAEKGCHLAEFQLGRVYMYGLSGIQADKDQAFSWMKRAAQGGLAGAQHNLGYMYQEGVGVTKDVQMAWIWYGKAARQGKIESQEVLIKANKSW